MPSGGAVAVKQQHPAFFFFFGRQGVVRVCGGGAAGYTHTAYYQDEKTEADMPGFENLCPFLLKESDLCMAVILLLFRCFCKSLQRFLAEERKKRIFVSGAYTY